VTVQIAPYLNAVVVNGGSDLHLKAGGPPRIRISGSLVPLQVEPLTPEQSWEIIRETMPAEVADEFAATNEADYAIHLPGIGRAARSARCCGWSVTSRCHWRRSACPTSYAASR
jgi:twitching motility protein PilT